MIERDVIGGAAHLLGLHPLEGHDRHRRDPRPDGEGRGHGPAGRRCAARLRRRWPSGSAPSRTVSSGPRSTSSRARACGCSQGTGRLVGPRRRRGRHGRRSRRDRCRRRRARPPAAGRGSRAGPSPTADASSPPATPIRRPSCPSTWWSSAPASPASSSSTCSPPSAVEVTLIVSRQQVLPAEGPRGGRGSRGRLPRAVACASTRAPGPRHRASSTTGSRSSATTAARRRAAMPCWPSAPSPTPRASASTPPESSTRRRLRRRRPQLLVVVPRASTPPATSRGSCRCPRWPRCRGARSPSTPWASTSGAHRHLDYDKAASAIFTVPEIADVGLAEADAFAEGRKIRVTKVPFSANAKALIDERLARVREDHLRPGHRRGPRRVDRRPPRRRAHLRHRAGRHRRPARCTTSYESLLVHPTLAEALSDAAE